MRIHHIGYLVKNIDKAQEKFETLGFQIEKPTVYDATRDIYIEFLSKDGYIIELVSSATKDSPVYDLYKRIRNSPYHICYLADSFENNLEQLASEGFTQIGEAAPSPALDGKKVVFLYSAAIGMIEILEE